MYNAAVVGWPPPPLSPNARPHFYTKAKATKEYRSLIAYHAKGGAMIDRAILYIVPLVRDRRRRDFDNVSAKAAIDGLTDARWWTDDSCIEWAVISKPIYSKSWPENSVLFAAVNGSRGHELWHDMLELKRRAAAGEDCVSWLSIFVSGPR
jgi:Holliday junction resolvase RusA-like endonuclease